MAARAFALAACCCAATAQPEFIANVRAYGAVGDGVTLDTAAFVAAVAAVAAARGGVVYVPPGQYLIAPINLTSALELRLDDATIVASARVRGPCQFTDWDVIAPLPSYARGRDFPGPRYTSLLHAYNLSGVRVTSNSSAPGVIDGNGAAWWACIVNGTLKVTPGHLFESLYSTGIVIDNTVWRDSPFWTIHPFASRNIHIYDVRVEAPIHRHVDGRWFEGGVSARGAAAAHAPGTRPPSRLPTLALTIPHPAAPTRTASTRTRRATSLSSA